MDLEHSNTVKVLDYHGKYFLAEIFPMNFVGSCTAMHTPWHQSTHPICTSTILSPAWVLAHFAGCKQVTEPPGLQEASLLMVCGEQSKNELPP